MFKLVVVCRVRSEDALPSGSSCACKRDNRNKRMVEAQDIYTIIICIHVCLRINAMPLQHRKRTDTTYAHMKSICVVGYNMCIAVCIAKR